MYIPILIYFIVPIIISQYHYKILLIGVTSGTENTSRSSNFAGEDVPVGLWRFALGKNTNSKH